MAGTGSIMIKIVLHGTMLGSQTWSTGFFLAIPAATAVPSAADCTAAAAAANAAALTWWGSIKSQEAPYCSYVGARAYAYAAGSSTSSATGEATSGSPVPGTNGSANVPYVSLVASLRTATSSRSTRGRMYVPYTGGNVIDTNGQATTFQTTAWANAIHDLLATTVEQVAVGLSQPSTELVVASFTDGKVTPVTQIRVDSLPDVQHRRTDKLGAANTAVVAFTG